LYINLIIIILIITAAKHETPNIDPYNTSFMIPITIVGIHPVNSGLCNIQNVNEITPSRGAISSDPVGIIGVTDTILNSEIIEKGIVLYVFNII